MQRQKMANSLYSDEVRKHYRVGAVLDAVGFRVEEVLPGKIMRTERNLLQLQTSTKSRPSGCLIVLYYDHASCKESLDILLHRQPHATTA
jgi:hypothetical protein